MFFLPKKRSELLVQNVGEETILYDQVVHKAFCLNAAASAIWHRCDGASTLVEATHAASRATGAPVAAETALLMLGSLEQQGLLEPGTGPQLGGPAGANDALDPSRRKALVAGAALLLPAVLAVMVPRAAEAYTCLLYGAGHTCIIRASQQAGTAAVSSGDQPHYTRHSRRSED